ncbi:MAG: hypothetical protein K0U98_26270 [Deltaproteobacteria bacterium]|nr:hypothetical protein [Deltaproteobacteria bacterium]
MKSRYPRRGFNFVRVLVIWFVAMTLVGCSGNRLPATTEQRVLDDLHEAARRDQNGEKEPEPQPLPSDPGQEEPSPASASDPIGSDSTPEESEVPSEEEADSKESVSLLKLCRQETPPEEEAFFDESRRRLQELCCCATLWLDGLLGGEPDVANARAVSGRLHITALYSRHEKFEEKIRLRVNYDLPTLERRLSVFLGKEDEEKFIQDRQETFAIRSSFFDIDSEDRWLAGLGYRPPGKWTQRLDFSVGGELRSAPEVFVKGRWRRNLFLGQRSVLRLKETVFWENRDGLGSTTRIDLDHLFGKQQLVRWGNVGTISEESDGFEWRSSLLFYRNLYSGAALAVEGFVRGATEREEKLREYGVRSVFRHTLHRRWLFGEIITGYSWPQEDASRHRRGSALVGVGLELHFGKDPY